MKNPIIKRIIWILIFAVLFYTAFVIWSDARKNVQTLRQFPWRHLPLILGAVLMNLWIRELKWDYFRRMAGIRVPRFGSFLVFFSGYSMCISPGRVGELIKPFMYKEYFDQKMRRTVPLVFCERLSDLLGMIVLAGAALSGFATAVQSHNDQSWLTSSFIYGFLIFSAAFMVVLVWVLRQKRWFYGLLFALGKVGALRKVMHKMRKVYYATYPLLTVRNLAITTGLAAFSWSFECLALYWILHGVGATSVTFSQATFIFCMATIFGGFLFFLPGGIGGFETTMAIMLSILGVPPYQSAPAVILIRFCTLFFSVALGFLFILMTSLKYHKGLEWEEFEHADSEAM
ncbi:MAG: flippase-like domain-containing protein [Candidatus Sumerlaea chitinivorans]|uniref:Integral membrane protein n=1 Tax=Sumerlaea chitinivorans TaxID=2250252 RepID=A0A2Z4Y8J9_SUMC1|nr:Integral membrane protein [Candidatus Sumerlaea chitinivorans]MCX7963666.1 flippase-like domain-containing protein [Candidatus Sumerlaea chitinivorans]